MFSLNLQESRYSSPRLQFRNNGTKQSYVETKSRSDARGSPRRPTRPASHVPSMSSTDHWRNCGRCEWENLRNSIPREGCRRKTSRALKLESQVAGQQLHEWTHVVQSLRERSRCFLICFKQRAFSNISQKIISEQYSSHP